MFPRSHVPFRFASQKNKSHARFHGSVFRISFASEVATNSWQRDSPRQEIDKRGVGRIGEDTRIRDCTATRYIRGYTLATTRPKCLIFPWLSANTNDRETNQFSRYDVVLRKFLEYEETFQMLCFIASNFEFEGKRKRLPCILRWNRIGKVILDLFRMGNIGFRDINVVARKFWRYAREWKDSIKW